MKDIIRPYTLMCLLVIFGSLIGLTVSSNDIKHSGEFSESNKLQLWLTISAQKRFMEISWINAPAQPDDFILLTNQKPNTFKKFDFEKYTPLAKYDDFKGSAYVPIDGYTTSINTEDYLANKHKTTVNEYWISSNGPKDVIAAIKPSLAAQWFTTGVPFDFNLSRNVTSNTGCYGYWTSYINGKGEILATACMRAYPRWMGDIRHIIGNFRLRDLFIPGTHDSGSVKLNFDPLLRETLVTKYALTQDDDIKGQLMHGARYLDLRIGYYKNLPEKFYINHGITRHRPLNEVMEQIKEFIKETNEIIIVGFKEFPIGFGDDLNVHRLLVQYLNDGFGDLIIDPSLTWSATLNDIWARKKNVILAYDETPVVREFPQLLFESVQQRWGNVRTWPKLEKYLREVNNRDTSRSSSRPVSDMAELTPDTWDVIRDRMGGLRKMADDVNWRISKLYREELARKANIVSVDFIRGTYLMDLAIEINQRKKA